MGLNSVDEILDFAIHKEEEAAQFYIGMAALVASHRMRELVMDFAQEEQRHRSKLTQVKQGRRMLPSEQKILDLGIAEQLGGEPDTADTDKLETLSYQDLLILAMKREKASFKLYTGLAEATDDADMKTLFHGLAQEEAKHKLYFEIEYDEHILTDN